MNLIGSASCSINSGDTRTPGVPLDVRDMSQRGMNLKTNTCCTKGLAERTTAQRERQHNNVTQICCVMLPRRSHCGSGSIYAVWFLLEGCWPILGAYCDPHTRTTTQQESHLIWHDADNICFYRDPWHDQDKRR